MKKIAKGYTIIELVVVIAIIGVLAAITIVGYTSVQQGARNTQRSTGLVAVSEALERYYNKNGEYPACAAIVGPTPNQVVTDTLLGLDPTDLTAPTDTAGTNSFASCGDPATPAKYGYVLSSGAFTLKYKEEGGGVKVAAVARHIVPSSNFSLAVKVDPSTPWGTVSGGGSYASGATATITATPNSWYSFDVWDPNSTSPGCYTPNTASHTITVSANIACQAKFKVIPVTAPATPVVNNGTVGATTTWTWGAATCTGGNTARYQYRYTIIPPPVGSGGYDSGWVATAATFVNFTTSTEGQTYDVVVQAQCYNPVISSSWSASSASSPYTRPITIPTGLTATTASSTSIDVSWNSVASATSYTLQRSLSSSFTSPTDISQVGTTYTSTGLSQGVKYYYQVKANNAGGSSAWSAAANATTTIDPPATPIDNVSTVGATSTWTWNSATCAGGTSPRYQYDYTITPPPVGSGGYDSGWVATAATSVAFTTSTEGLTYTVYVQAQCYNGVTTSSWSASDVDGYTRPITIPTGLTATTASSTSINTSWGSVASATSYTLGRSTASDFTVGYTEISQAGTTYTSSGLSQGVRYYYRVKANNAGGSSAWSTSANATTTINTPTPNTPTTSNSTVGVTTTWTFSAETCASGTTLQYQYDYTFSPSGYDSGWVATATPSFAATTSTEGQTYNVIVQARCYTGATTSAWTSSSADSAYYRVRTWSQISVGDRHTCGVASNGQAYCWGSNSHGQLGNNSTTSSSSPVAVNTAGVLSGKTVSQISAGNYFTCAIAHAVISDNRAYCWGSDTYGQLGDDTNNESHVPVAIHTGGVLLNGNNLKKIDSGYFHTCATASVSLDPETAYCWGWNYNGQLGENTTTDKKRPWPVNVGGVLGGKTVMDIDSGTDHSCAIANNRAYCWGANDVGQLADDSSAESHVPVAVYTGGIMGTQTVSAISAGGEQSCAVAGNDAYCWGYNNYGQVGENTTNSRHRPWPVDTSGALSGKTVTTISAGGFNACVIASDNLAYCWGFNDNGEVGDNTLTERHVPAAVYTAGALSGKTISSISVGAIHTCAIASDSQAYCWGYNDSGQLGDNISVGTNSKVPVLQPSPPAP